MGCCLGILINGQVVNGMEGRYREMSRPWLPNHSINLLMIYSLEMVFQKLCACAHKYGDGGGIKALKSSAYVLVDD